MVTIYPTFIDAGQYIRVMKRTVLTTLILLLIATATIYSDCEPGTSHPFPIPQVVGSWDCIRSWSTIDSLYSSYSATVYDSFFSYHTHNGYTFLANDSFVYTDYTVTPAVVETGKYYFPLFNGYQQLLILTPTSGSPDSLSFIPDGGNEFKIAYITTYPRYEDSTTEYYLYKQ